MRWRALRLLLLTLLASAALLLAATPAARAETDAGSDGGPGPTKAPTAFINHQMDRLFQRKDRLDDEIAALQRTAQNVASYVAALQGAKGDATKIGAAQAELQKLLKTPPPPKQRESWCQDIQRGYSNLFQVANAPVAATNPRALITPDATGTIVRQIFDSVPFGMTADFGDRVVFALDECLRATTDDFVVAASKVAGGAALQHSAEVAYWSRISERIQSEIGDRKRELEAISAQLNELQAKATGEETNKQITQDLVGQVILPMIGALVALFVLLLWFSRRVQLQIVDRRTLVEIIGIAFLLITILTLGAAGKIDSSIVGTLLGSIASYIFSQQISQRMRESSGDTKPAPSGPSTSPVPVSPAAPGVAESPTPPPAPDGGPGGSGAGGGASRGANARDRGPALALLIAGALGCMAIYAGVKASAAPSTLREWIIAGVGGVSIVYALLSVSRGRQAQSLPLSGQLSMRGAPSSTLLVGDIVRVQAEGAGSRALLPWWKNAPHSALTRWFSSAESVATVVDGVIVGIGAGKARITATYGAAEGHFELAVADVSSINIVVASALVVGDVVPLAAHAETSLGDRRDLDQGATWSVAPATVLQIRGSSLAAIGGGAGTLELHWRGRTASRNITVRTVTNLAMNVAATITRGQPESLRVIATLSDGTTKDVSDEADVVALDPHIASINEGQVVATAPGTARFTAEWRGSASPQVALTAA